TVTAIAGVASFANLSYNVTETITIVFTSGTLTRATSDNVVVSPGAAARLQVLLPDETSAHVTANGKTGLPTAQIALVPITNGIVVNAVETHWNVVASSLPNVAIASSDTIATIADDNGGAAGNMTLSSGTGTLSSFTFYTGGTTRTITATDAAAILTSNVSTTVTVNKAPATT